ncbi:hypothetical protein COCON_G00106910 [Conger conger]|uniref:Uncharacterized protein n=1 Tax=Conger conger TaxID=82655 RepID=A0A9Q1DIT1_CONCO|nr:hypothetical protein COCON_G00106910 [Conger conger]
MALLLWQSAEKKLAHHHTATPRAFQLKVQFSSPFLISNPFKHSPVRCLLRRFVRLNLPEVLCLLKEMMLAVPAERRLSSASASLLFLSAVPQALIWK